MMQRSSPEDRSGEASVRGQFVGQSSASWTYLAVQKGRRRRTRPYVAFMLERGFTDEPVASAACPTIARRIRRAGGFP